MRGLYRESFLNAHELQERLSKLKRLKNGELKPVLQAVDRCAPAGATLLAAAKSSLRCLRLLENS